MTSQTFYGLSMHWAQYCGMYDIGQVQEPRIPRSDEPTEAKANAWKSWVARETQIRVLLGLCVVDGVVSQFSGNMVNTCAATKRLPLASKEEAFSAEHADAWILCMTRKSNCTHAPDRRSIQELYRDVTSDPPCSTHFEKVSGLLNITMLLEAIAASATVSGKTQKSRGDTQPERDVSRALNTIRHLLLRSTSLTAAERTISLIRWHAICMDLIVNTADGARKMCFHYNIPQHIFGGQQRQEPKRANPEAWASGRPARTCLLHALEIHKLAAEVPLGMIHNTCLPGALFTAATTFASFALPGLIKISTPPLVDWRVVLHHQELDADLTSTFERAGSGQTEDTTRFLRNSGGVPLDQWVARNLLYELSSIRNLLHSVSQSWGVTEEMEQVVLSWERHCI